jgi:integrase
MSKSFTVKRRIRPDCAPDWKVEVRAPDGKRVRRFFPSKVEAETFAADSNREVKSNGWRAMGLADDQRTEAAKCFEKLAARPGHTLTEAVDFFLAHLALTEGSATVKDTIDDLQDAKASRGLSPAHLNTMRHHYRAFAESFGSRKIATITRLEIEKWMHARKMPAASFRGTRTYLGMLFAAAVKAGTAKVNPVKDIELPKAKVKPPEILTPKAMRCLITECRTHHPDILAAVLIQAFAGLRREEAARLNWSEVRLDRGHIEVTAENSKTSQRRLVTIRPNLAAFLAPLRREAGPVMPSCYNLCATALRRLVIKAGHKYGKNALRHSFASYHLADCEDAAKTALQLGHKGTAVLFEHYRELVMPADAAAWWAITPKDAKGGNIVTLAKPAAVPVDKRRKKGAVA